MRHWERWHRLYFWAMIALIAAGAAWQRLAPPRFVDLGRPVNSIAVRADGSAVIASDSRLVAWSPGRDRPRDLTPDRALAIGAANQQALRPDGAVLAAELPSGQIGLFETAGGRPLQTLGARRNDWKISALAWSTDGRFLAASAANWRDRSQPEEIAIWDLQAGKGIAAFEGLPSPNGDRLSIHALAWQPGNQALAVRDDCCMRIWSLVRWQYIATATEPGRYARDMAWSPDGAAIAAGRNLYRWDGRRALPIRYLGDSKGAISSIAFSPDGRMLAAGTGSWRETGYGMAIGDTAVYVWSLDDGALLGRFAGHRNIVTGLAWGPGGDWLVSGDWNGEARVWAIDRPGWP